MDCSHAFTSIGIGSVAFVSRKREPLRIRRIIVCVEQMQIINRIFNYVSLIAIRSVEENDNERR